MEQDLQLGMPRRIPLPQRFAHPCRDPCHHEATLGRNKMASHRCAVGHLRVALRQIGEIDIAENRETRHLGDGISNCARNRKAGQTKERENPHTFLDGAECHCFTCFLFHFDENTSIP
jgi:hypothetical protein